MGQAVPSMEGLELTAVATLRLRQSKQETVRQIVAVEAVGQGITVDFHLPAWEEMEVMAP